MSNFPTRYNLETICKDGDCDMEVDAHGEWVKFEDIKELLKTKYASALARQ